MFYSSLLFYVNKNTTIIHRLYKVKDHDLLSLYENDKCQSKVLCTLRPFSSPEIDTHYKKYSIKVMSVAVRVLSSVLKPGPCCGSVTAGRTVLGASCAAGDESYLSTAPFEHSLWPRPYFHTIYSFTSFTGSLWRYMHRAFWTHSCVTSQMLVWGALVKACHKSSKTGKPSLK